MSSNNWNNSRSDNSFHIENKSHDNNSLCVGVNHLINDRNKLGYTKNCINCREKDRKKTFFTCISCTEASNKNEIGSKQVDDEVEPKVSSSQVGDEVKVEVPGLKYIDSDSDEE